MKTIHSGLAIRGISAAVPPTIIDNSSYIGKYEKRKVNTQLRVTGIQSRHVANGSLEGKDLCLSAAKRLMQEFPNSSEEIKVLVFVTQTAKMITPSTAFWIHHNLGLSSDCMAFDVNLGCSGFVEGLEIISSLLQEQPTGSKGLLLNGDTLSHYIDEDDFGTCMMFGDAGTATLVERCEGYSISGIHNVQSSGFDKLIVKDSSDKLFMDGMQVFQFTINEATAQIQSLERSSDIKPDYYLIHQAQQYIVRNITELCSWNEDKVLTSYEEYGNVSGATIPLTICKHMNKFQNRHDYHLLVSGFGVGLSYASAFVTLKKPKVLGVETLK